MSLLKNVGLQVQEYEYEVVTGGDLGTVGIIDLSAKANKKPLPIGAKVVQVYADILTAFVGVGASLQWGSADDTDGYHAVKAVGTLTLNAQYNGHDGANALLFDDTGKYAKVHKVLDANDGKFVVEVTGAAFTAGRVRFNVVYMHDGVDA